MTSNRPTAHPIRQWSIGVGLAGAAAMIGLAAAAAAHAEDLDPSGVDLSVSYNGLSLIQDGNAVSQAGSGGWSIGFGDGATATSPLGSANDDAFAFGNGATAYAGYNNPSVGDNDIAIADGAGSEAVAGGGNNDFADAFDAATAVASGTNTYDIEPGDISNVPATAAAAAPTTPADLLGEASTNFTAAEDVFAGVPTTDLPDLVLYQTNVADTGLAYVNSLTGVGAAENLILSYDNGEFANLVSPLFTDLDQNWLQASEGLLSANTALVTAITDGTGPTAAEFGLITPDLQVMSDGFFSGIIDQSAYLLSMF